MNVEINGLFSNFWAFFRKQLGTWPLRNLNWSKRLNAGIHKESIFDRFRAAFWVSLAYLSNEKHQFHQLTGLVIRIDILVWQRPRWFLGGPLFASRSFGHRQLAFFGPVLIVWVALWLVVDRQPVPDLLTVRPARYVSRPEWAIRWCNLTEFDGWAWFGVRWASNSLKSKFPPLGQTNRMIQVKAQKAIWAFRIIRTTRDNLKIRKFAVARKLISRSFKPVSPEAWRKSFFGPETFRTKRNPPKYSMQKLAQKVVSPNG